MFASYSCKNDCVFYITDRKFGFYLWEIYLPNCEKPIKKGFTRCVIKAAEKIYKTYKRIVAARLADYCIDENG